MVLLTLAAVKHVVTCTFDNLDVDDFVADDVQELVQESRCRIVCESIKILSSLHARNSYLQWVGEPEVVETNREIYVDASFRMPSMSTNQSRAWEAVVDELDQEHSLAVTRATTSLYTFSM